MKRKIKKILSYLPPVFLDYFEIIFSSAAENHIRFNNTNRKKFRSYTQLKRQQKKIRMAVSIVLLTLFSIFLGILVQPVFFPQPIEPEVYVPNGKGDILLGNISKNQVTVIFKTLDSANGDKPLATKAIVEAYEDPQYTKLARRTNEDDYAVTHIIPVDSLQEGVTYYLKIIAKDAAIPQHSKIISAWGDGNDPIKVYTAGDLVSNCLESGAAINAGQPGTNNNIGNVNVTNMDVAAAAQEVPIDANQQADQNSLQIYNVQNENYLQPENLVQTIISWNTSVPASTALVYGAESSNEKIEIAANDQLQTRHQVVLTTLKAGATYYFKVKSVDLAGNNILSEEYSLRTPRPQQTVVEKIADSFKAIFKQIKPR